MSESHRLSLTRSSVGLPIAGHIGGRRIARSVAFAVSQLALLLLFGSTAHAAGSATVTVRVEGFNGETLLPQAQVTTSAEPVPVEGGVCSGTSAGGALFDATHGSWKVKNDGANGVEIDGIDGLVFPSFAEKPDAYWAFWLNNEFATQGACGQEVENGADIVFAAQCDALGPDCPTSATSPDHFLTSSPPSSTVVQAGTPVSVTIGSVNTITGVREASLPANVTVTAGPVSASPNAQGVATLVFPAPGRYTLQARAPDSVPSDPYAVCVHNGNDGTCGTSAPGSATGFSPASDGLLSFSGSSYNGPYAVVAKALGLIDGHVYRRGHAPRVLDGTVLAHRAIASVSLRLRREYRGRCYAYDGAREEFGPARCGKGSYFKVSTAPSFSYLLPSALAPGRYVLDIEATDIAGNRTTLARGTSRIVFYVE